jgi:hypothetical protein
VRAAKIPGAVLVSVRPTGRPSDFLGLISALGEAAQLAAIPKVAPHEDRRCRDPAIGRAVALLAGSILREQSFHKRVLGAGRERARSAAKEATLAALIQARRTAAAIPSERALAARGAQSSVAEEWATLQSDALRAAHDPRLQLTPAPLGLPLHHELRAQAIASALRAALRERFDEDFWRNPRTGPFLTGLFVRGTVADALDVLADVSPEAHGTRLVKDVERS